MKNVKKYMGIDEDEFGGMTETGRIIRQAWAFGLIPESETCEGWLMAGVEDLWRKVNAEWEKYGFLVGNLPPEIRERFDRIEKEAIEKARAAGWDPELRDDDQAAFSAEIGCCMSNIYRQSWGIAGGFTIV